MRMTAFAFSAIATVLTAPVLMGGNKVPLRLSLTLETLSGKPSSAYLPQEPVLFAAALENMGSKAMDAISLYPLNGACTAVVQDAMGKEVGKGSFESLLVFPGKPVPSPPEPGDLQSIHLGPGGRDEQRGDLLRLIGKSLPPGNYKFRLLYHARAIRLESQAVEIHVVEPSLTSVSFAWPSGKSFLNLALLQQSGADLELRHECRSSLRPDFVIAHGEIGRVAREAVAACESGATPKSPGKPIWIAVVSGGTLVVYRSASGASVGNPVRHAIDNWRNLRLAGPVMELTSGILVPVTGYDGQATVLALFLIDANTGALKERRLLRLFDQPAALSHLVTLDNARAAIAIATPDKGARLKIESREFDIPDGANVRATILGTATGKLLAMAAGPHASFAAVCEDVEQGAAYRRVYRFGGFGNAITRLVFEPELSGTVRETGAFIDSHEATYVAFATASGDVYGGQTDAPIPRLAHSVAWPSHGLVLAPIEEYPDGVRFAYVSRESGMLFPPARPGTPRSP